MPPSDISDMVRSVYQLMFFRICEVGIEKKLENQIIAASQGTHNCVDVLVESLVLAEDE